MREDIENYWKVFKKLCKAVAKYADWLHAGLPDSGEYYLKSVELVGQLDEAAGKVGLPKMGSNKENESDREDAIRKETSLLINSLFDDELREAYLAEAEKVRGEAVSMTDLRMGAMVRLGYIKKSKVRPSINKEVQKAKEIEKKSERKVEKKTAKAERKVEKKTEKAAKAERKAEEKTEKAWRKAANA